MLLTISVPGWPAWGLRNWCPWLSNCPGLIIPEAGTALSLMSLMSYSELYSLPQLPAAGAQGQLGTGALILWCATPCEATKPSGIQFTEGPRHPGHGCALVSSGLPSQPSLGGSTGNQVGVPDQHHLFCPWIWVGAGPTVPGQHHQCCPWGWVGTESSVFGQHWLCCPWSWTGAGSGSPKWHNFLTVINSWSISCFTSYGMELIVSEAECFETLLSIGLSLTIMLLIGLALGNYVTKR